jgi:chemotaxis protein methyltransferase CheR
MYPPHVDGPAVSADQGRPGTASFGELSVACGLRLDAFRPEHVAERIDRAAAAEQVDDVRALAARLRRDERARERFRRSVAVSHSGFFRDPEQFEALELRVLPRLLEHRTRRMRVWSAGCANGLELWTMAVVLNRLGVLETAHLLGSDLLEENLAVARAGVYDIVEISAALRVRPRWERRDLVHDPAPRGPWDCILCRNVAIYLEASAKARLHRRLAEVLSPRGVLVLGRSERLPDPAALGLRRVEAHVYERPA